MEKILKNRAPLSSRNVQNLDGGPEKVLLEIEKQLKERIEQPFYLSLTCRSIDIGSYVVNSTDSDDNFVVVLTSLGMKFCLPNALNQQSTKLCIPMESILEIKIYFESGLLILYVKTGPKHASWIRRTLGMCDDPKKLSGYYFCPLKGIGDQKSITMVSENVTDSTVKEIKRIYADVLNVGPVIPTKRLKSKTTTILGVTKNSLLTTKSNPEITSSTKSQIRRHQAANSSSKNTFRTTSLSITKKKEKPEFLKSLQIPTISKKEKRHDPASIKNMDKAVFVYLENTKAAVGISPNDIKRLQFPTYLNDQLIKFWLTYIQMEKMDETDRHRTHIFDSLFYSELNAKIRQKTRLGPLSLDDQDKLRKWTRNEDIFQKDYLVVPINRNSHWIVAVVCFPGMNSYPIYKALMNSREQKSRKHENFSSSSESTAKGKFTESRFQPAPPAGVSHKSFDAKGRKCPVNIIGRPCIMLFDSLPGTMGMEIFDSLREYLRMEFETKHQARRTFNEDNFPGIIPIVPKQPNDSDCGLFMLQYVESFLVNPIIPETNSNLDLTHWFSATDIVKNKRKVIYDYICSNLERSFPERMKLVPKLRFDLPQNNFFCKSSGPKG